MESQETKKKKGNSQNLEVISSAESTESGISKLDAFDADMIEDSYRERRHLPRLSLCSEQFKVSPTGKIFSVTDLTQRGMGLWLFDSNDMALFTVGGYLEGTLNLKRVKYPVQARVRNLSSDRIGCEFENLSDTTLHSIALFLNPATLGVELKPIPSTELRTLWYHGPSGTDLLVKRGVDGQFQRIILFALGSFVQWDESEGVMTGCTAPTETHSEIRGIHRLETLYLDPDAAIDPEKLKMAKTVVLSSTLPVELKKVYARQLTGL